MIRPIVICLLLIVFMSPHAMYGGKMMEKGLFCSLPKADPESLKLNVERIIAGEHSRNYLNTDELDRVADYIKGEFGSYGLSTEYQDYKFKYKTYRNVIARIGSSGKPKLVIGAHYDVCGNQMGADDNASGVSGLLELARIIKPFEDSLKYQLELVAFSLEEPPFFRKIEMGSHVHAKSLRNKGEEIVGMISLEMIGYFSDQPGSQNYPLGIMKWFYPDKGDFIAVVSNIASRSMVNKLKKSYLKTTVLPCEKLIAPSSVNGVDFSDHRNYWKFGYKAAMITDTAFMRNKNYHTTDDTIEKLDFGKMALVVDGLVNLVCSGKL